MGNCKSASVSKSANRKLTLAILGLDNAGKTVAAKGLKGDSVDGSTPTIGFSSVDFRFEQHYVTLFDLGGGKNIRGIWKKYFAEIYGLIYVVDASDAKRMDECRNVLTGLLDNDLVRGKPLLLLANKNDVDGALDECDICDRLQLEDLVNQHRCPCRVETCSATFRLGKKIDSSIQLGFRWLVRLIDTKWEELSERVTKDIARKEQDESKEKLERTERVRRSRELRDKESKDDEDEVDGGGDPFRPINQQLKVSQQRELANKQANKKRSESTSYQNGSRTPEGNGVSYGSGTPLSGRKTYSTRDDDDRLTSKPPSNHNRALPSISQRIPYHDDDDDDNNNDDDDDDKVNYRTPTNSYQRSNNNLDRRSTPPALDNSKSVVPYRSSVNMELEKRGYPTRGALQPISQLAPIDSDPKKVKKRIRFNQTLPTSDDDMDVGDRKTTSLKLPALSSRTRSPLAPIGRASQSPRLDRLDEDDDDAPSVARKWNLVDELPEMDEPRYRKPPANRYGRSNSDYYDDDIIT